VVLAIGYTAGSIPFTGLAARLCAGVDLRSVGTGTVSGTGLHAVAGFGPLAVAGSLDVLKGVVGPLLAGADRPGLQAAAVAAGICGHNWSPWLGGAGGRGVATALGALGVAAPEGAVAVGAGLALGRLAHQSGLGVLIAVAALPALLGIRRGRSGAMLGAAVAAPMVAKRLLGNRPVAGDHRARQRIERLLFDRDGPLTTQ
jgi:glycerol-3-phosphate acyltransferase PlsY